MRKEYLLGIDIGTSGCKAAVFTKEGTVAARASAGYDTVYEKPGYAAQNPKDWWQAVCRCIRQILDEGHVKAEEIEAVGVDGQSWSVVPVRLSGKSEHDKELGMTPIWLDTRAKDICLDLQKNGLGAELEDRSGNPLSAAYCTGKALWLKQHMPDIYKQSEALLQSNAYIVWKLTNRAVTDLSQGYGYHFFDMEKGEWDKELCMQTGLRYDLMPPLVPSHEIAGYVTKEAAALCGLKEGTPVAAGGLDAACGALGVGVLFPGQVQEQGGQAGGMSICMDQCRKDRRLILGFHVVPGRWLLQGGTTGGGGVMRWLGREMGDYEKSIAGKTGKSEFEQLCDLAAGVCAGSDGLLFLPYMAGERSPIWNPSAKGVYYGLDFSKTKGHMIRSALEGTAFALKHNIETAKEAKACPEVLRAMGGSANSVLWTQIKSDVTGLPIEVASSDTATTWGAAILAGVGCGMFSGFDEAVRESVHIRRYYEPKEENRAVYEKQYEKYLELYRRLEPMMC